MLARVLSVSTLELLPACTPLPAVQPRVVAPWSGRLRDANTYKECTLASHWMLWTSQLHRIALMLRVAALWLFWALGLPMHFWSCPVAAAVRHEVESQLIAFGFLAAGASLPCSAIWLACKPYAGMHRLVWDMVCLAAIHAFERGRRAAWAVSDQLSVPVLVEQVAVRSAVGAFWEALADFAATSKVPRRMRNATLTHQPFLSWHVVLVRGSGLRVVRL